MSLYNKVNNKLFIIAFFGFLLAYSVYKVSVSFAHSQLFNHVYASQWVIDWFYPEKIYQLVGFILSITALFFYYFLIYKLREDTLSNRVLNAILACNDNNSVNLRALYQVAFSVVILLLILYSLVFNLIYVYSVLLFFIYVFIKKYKILNVFSRNGFFYIIMLFGFIQLINIFYPYLKGDLRFINEFLEIPQQIIIDGEYKSNSVLLNDPHKLGMNRGAIDEHDEYIENPNSSKVQIEYSKNLEKFIGKFHTRYFYDKPSQSLVLNHGALTVEEYSLLSYISKAKADDMLNIANLTKKIYPHLSKEEVKEKKDHKFELTWQILNRWVVHHHSYVYIPINELNLGKPIRDIYMQYGLLNTVLLKSILNFIGDVNFNKYFQVWFSFFFIYYLLYAYVLKKLFINNPEYQTIGWIGSISVLGFIGFQFLQLGPGLNPVRHFFDLITLVFIYKYMITDDFSEGYFWKKSFFILCISIVSILNNYQTGLVLSLSIVGTILVANTLSIKKISLRTVIFIMLIIVNTISLIYLLISDLYDPLSHYYLQGLLGFPFNNIYIYAWIIFNIFAYTILYKAFERGSRLKQVGLFITFYSQGLALYTVWGGTIYHALNYAPIYILFILVIFFIAFEDNKLLNNLKKEALKIGIMITLLIFFIFSVVNFDIKKTQFNKVFEVSKTYNWNFDAVKLKSTIDPKYFKSAISLIEKYSTSNGIFIISKYDQILTILSKKYSNMPFFDMAWFVLSQKEIDLAIEKLKHKKPQYIFVDKIIADNRLISHTTTYDENLNKESLKRYLRLKELEKVFNGVKNDYSLVDSSSLIEVYKRK